MIVIGLGFCGLVAARNLALNRNLRVLLLEARDRIGGRTWTAKAWGEEFEMGGTFVHWYLDVHKHIHRTRASTDIVNQASTSLLCRNAPTWSRKALENVGRNDGYRYNLIQASGLECDKP